MKKVELNLYSSKERLPERGETILFCDHNYDWHLKHVTSACFLTKTNTTRTFENGRWVSSYRTRETILPINKKSTPFVKFSDETSRGYEIKYFVLDDLAVDTEET